MIPVLLVNAALINAILENHIISSSITDSKTKPCVEGDTKDFKRISISSGSNLYPYFIKRPGLKSAIKVSGIKDIQANKVSTNTGNKVSSSNCKDDCRISVIQTIKESDYCAKIRNCFETASNIAEIECKQTFALVTCGEKVGECIKDIGNTDVCCFFFQCSSFC